MFWWRTKSPSSQVYELGLGQGGEGGEGEGQPCRGESAGEGGLRDVGQERHRQEEGQRSQ